MGDQRSSFWQSGSMFNCRQLAVLKFGYGYLDNSFSTDLCSTTSSFGSSLPLKDPGSHAQVLPVTSMQEHLATTSMDLN
ncbi:hypothetical protein SynA1524_01710 [Synechococcus sp. A15-24]|nr:hypothetical protein SynA1524_01710 [Synechococcus sp. A15-24]